MRVLHAADLHLDSAFGMGRFAANVDQAVDDQRQVLTQLVDLALVEQPDALLLAGDLFHIPHLTRATKSHMAKQFARLKELPVLIAPGNHDPYTAYRGLRFPANVRVFAHRWTAHDLGAGVVWGYGHYDEQESGSVMERLRVKDRRRVNVVLFHGSDLGTEQRKHARFAGFTRQEMIETGADYFALGHIHWAIGLQGPSGRLLGCYSGAIRGLGSGKKGNKGVFLATVTKSETTLQAFLGTRDGFVAGEVQLEGYDQPG